MFVNFLNKIFWRISEQSIYVYCIYSYSTINVQSKVNEAKQSKNDAKIANSCKKIEANTSKRTSETNAKRISVRFFSL